MAINEHTCPGCGETEHLSGHGDGDQITVTCHTCGRTWTREESRCRTCGGDDLVTRPQPLSYYPRGNQLAIIGWRDARLCRVCDREAVATSLEKNQPVPRDYVPRAGLLPVPARGPASAGQRAEARQTQRKPKSRTPTRVVRPAAARVEQREPIEAPRQPEDPTARQAIEAFLTTPAGATAATAMLMLGTYLGPSSRMSQLPQPSVPDELREWLERTWPPASSSRSVARQAVRAAIEYWIAQSWLPADSGAALVAALREP